MLVTHGIITDALCSCLLCVMQNGTEQTEQTAKLITQNIFINNHKTLRKNPKKHEFHSFHYNILG